MLPSSSAKDAANRYSYTEVRTERILHDWTIKRFHLLPEGVDEKICSPWFYSQDKSEKWNFQFYPRGHHDNSSEGIEYIALYLARESPGKSPITVDARLSISKSNVILKKASFTVKYGPQEARGRNKFVGRSRLLTTNSSDDDEFTISCIIDIPARVITSSFDAAIFNLKRNPLSNDFRLLFENPILSDFTIIVEDKRFATHQVILASRSSVFAAMFKHKDMEENRKKEMRIENIEADVIKGMLEFIYTNHVTNIKGLASGLLEAAEKYDLEELRIMCEKTLYEGLNEENAAEVLQLADLYRADTLKKYAIKYIVDHAPELVKSNNLKKTEWNPELLLELFDQLALSQAANNEKSESSKA